MSMAHRLYISYPPEIDILKTWEKICQILEYHGKLEPISSFTRHDPYLEYEFEQIDSTLKELIKDADYWTIARNWQNKIFLEKEDFSDLIEFYNWAQRERGLELPNPLDDTYSCRIYLKHFLGLAEEEYSRILDLAKDIAVNTEPTRIIPGNNAVEYKYKYSKTPTGIHMISLDNKFADPNLEYKNHIFRV